jgi:hypothetical protein
VSSVSEKRMKLFIAGEVSSDPAEWDHFGNCMLVLAESSEEALSITGGMPVVEVCMDSPAVLFVT